MTPSSQLFIGITTWNSEQFLAICLDSLRRTAPDAEIVILDNESSDDTLAIAGRFDARIVVKRSGQGDALDALATLSKRPFTLLIHADVVMISPIWVETVLKRFKANVALVSPEDIGCGPFTRPHGRGKPESSFMCFETRHIDKLRVRRWMRKFRLPYYKSRVDFYGEHVTYNLPMRLADAGLTWFPMKVHVSEYRERPYYVPTFKLLHWMVEMGHLRYGLGNFYSLDGVVTHYHNWYDRRVDRTKKFEPTETLEINGGGVPVEYLKAYSERFIADYKSGQVVIPAVA